MKIKDKAFKPAEFEKKYQDLWVKNRIYQPDLKKAKNPFYNLMMFPYPSAEGLHVGNVYAFTGADIYGRYKRMKGYDVFEPIGLDGFGIHSENYALKMGRHPAEQAKISAKNFYRQLYAIGNSFAWENTLETYDPDYYKWTQWIFVQMFKHGLAYRKKSLVNFCPSCKTVLSDEQVIDGVCERCKSVVEKRELEQWFFKITAYAEKLLQNTFKESFQWSEKVKVGQRNWIEKKTGINIRYPIIAGPDVILTPSLSRGKNPIGINENGRDPSSVSRRTQDDTLTNVTCFTTRPDTNFGATFVVVAPEHPFVHVILSQSEGSLAPACAGRNASSNHRNLRDPAEAGQLRDSSSDRYRTQNDKIKEIKDYVEKAKKKSEMERIAEGRKKTGVFTGYYAVNQLNNYKMPIFVTDFVLGHVGTGAVVGVPGHDKRDFEFAKEFNLPIVRVVVGKDGDKSPITKIEQVQEEEGRMVNSQFLDGLNIHQATEKMMDYIEKKGWGKRVTTYKLRDWCISRQRYWGAPIPMIYCRSCAKKGVGWLSLNRVGPLQGPTLTMAGWYPVPEEDLPVLLPPLSDWKPEGTGKGPLAKVVSFVETKCPHCGSEADRETDVCDTFLDSSWYYLRYPSINAPKPPLTIRGGKRELPWDLDITRQWLPVHQYIGGAEHTVLHLLYARFVTLAIKDMGFLDFEEPFSRFYAHGLIIAEGAKMSKSKGNIVIPDVYVNKYGADTLRTYLMFLGPFDQGGDFRDTGIAGMYRFLGRVWRLVSDVILIPMSHREKNPKRNSVSGGDPSTRPDNTSGLAQDDTLTRVMHRTIKEVTEDMENLRYNTAIAHIMEFVNAIQNEKINPPAGGQNSGREIIETLLLLLAPFAPHMTEELYQFFKVKSQSASWRTKVKSNKVKIDNFESIHVQKWPEYDPKFLVEDQVMIIVQVNGKLRETIQVKSQKSKVKSEVEEMVKKSEKVRKYIEGKKVKKVIFVPGKLINFVV